MFTTACTRTQADAQLAYLVRQGHAHCVLSLDSDLLIYGCPRLAVPLDDGRVRLFTLSAVADCVVDGASLAKANYTLAELAALAGCGT